jgi:hypothetical protein
VSIARAAPTRSLGRILAASAVVVALWAPCLVAAEAPAHVHSHALCWRGHPPPECRSFIVTEFGVFTRLDDDPFLISDPGIAFTFELGYMRNISPRESIAVGVWARLEDSSRHALRARYRRWLSRNMSIDLSPGITFSGEEGSVDYDPPGLIGSASVNLGDLLSLTLEAEYSHYKDYGYGPFPIATQSRSDVSWRTGAKLGSGLGVAGAAALVGLVLYIGLNGGFD